MKILLSNDDGFRAKGLVALYEKLSEFAEVRVVAPEHNNSGKSNSITLNAPIYVNQADNGFYYVSGTPADCVHLTLTGMLDFRPDLVVSGINNGANMGDDTIYSGTVGAAMEGYLFGLPAIAFSQVHKDWSYIEGAARKACEFVKKMANECDVLGLNKPFLLNVNIPFQDYDSFGDFEWCRLGRRHSAEPVIKQQNPHGDTMYWIGAAGSASDDGVGTDFNAIKNNNISVTPLQIDLTHYAVLKAMTK